MLGNTSAPVRGFQSHFNCFLLCGDRNEVGGNYMQLKTAVDVEVCAGSRTGEDMLALAG